MSRRSGFTLVELVVVVMILGILAAVAAPKLLSTSSAATDNGLRQSLSVIRDAVERYAAENAGTLPGELGTDADFKADLKTLLRGGLPECPVGSPSKADEVKFVATDPPTGVATPTEGWAYNKATGDFIPNYSGKDSNGDQYDSY